MRPFARQTPITRLTVEARVLYTAFLLFTCVGLATSGWLYRDSFGDLRGRGVADYYLGAAPAEAAEDATVGGPALDLPAGADRGLRVAKSPRQLMETFHFHLFTVPLVLLVVGHIFMLTAVAVRRKVLVLAFASVATLLHLVAPLAVRFAGAGAAALMPASGLLVAVGWAPMMVWPLWEMWRPGAFEDELGPSR